MAGVDPTPDFILSEMLGDGLFGALKEARTRTADPTIMTRIGSSPDPDAPMPGLVSIERDGAETVYGLSEADALAQLAALA